MRRNLIVYFGVCIVIGTVVGLLYGWFAQPFGQKVQQSRQSEYFFERTAQLLEGEMQISSGSKESFQGRRIVIASPDEPSAVIDLDPEGHRHSGVFTFEMPGWSKSGSGPVVGRLSPLDDSLCGRVKGWDRKFVGSNEWIYVSEAQVRIPQIFRR